VRQRILEAFSSIRAQPVYPLIAQHLHLENAQEVSEEQKIAAYHEYLKLTFIRLEPLAEKLEFSLRGPDRERKRPGVGLMTTGMISPRGEITVLKTEPCALVCPL